VTTWQKIKRELGRETQPVGTIVRVIIIERSIVGVLVFVLGAALLTNRRGSVGLVAKWVAELNVNPERRVIPRILSAVLRPVGQFSMRTVVLIGSSTTRTIEVEQGRRFVYTPRSYGVERG